MTRDVTASELSMSTSWPGIEAAVAWLAALSAELRRRWLRRLRRWLPWITVEVAVAGSRGGIELLLPCLSSKLLRLRWLWRRCCGLPMTVVVVVTPMPGAAFALLPRGGNPLLLRRRWRRAGLCEATSVMGAAGWRAPAGAAAALASAGCALRTLAADAESTESSLPKLKTLLVLLLLRLRRRRRRWEWECEGAGGCCAASPCCTQLLRRGAARPASWAAPLARLL